MPYGIIYKATNKIDNKIYIGQTIMPLKNRLYVHKYDAKQPKPQDYFHRAIKKHGWGNFTWEILCECSTRQELNDKETEYIINLKSYHTFKVGYNLTYGGDYNPMFDSLVKEKQRKSLCIAMKKYCGDANVMRRQEVKEKHTAAMQQLWKDPAYLVSARQGFMKQKSIYDITFPDGHIERIVGLNEFCKIHKLSQSKMSGVVTGNRNHHKGFKCKLISNGSNPKVRITVP